MIEVCCLLSRKSVIIKEAISEIRLVEAKHEIQNYVMKY
jgi:hypothetical protein